MGRVRVAPSADPTIAIAARKDAASRYPLRVGRFPISRTLTSRFGNRLLVRFEVGLDAVQELTERVAARSPPLELDEQTEWLGTIDLVLELGV